MDISCEMELPFSEPSSLTGPAFEHTSSDIPVKLLGNHDDEDNLLHGNTDKHLIASDFKLDLGPANDLVTDFGISPDSLMIPDEPEGYSISDAALEEGVRPTEMSNNAVTMDTYLQSIPLVSGIQAVQVIPFGYLISGSKPDSDQHVTVSTAQNGLNISQNAATHIQTVHNAVVIGNLMVLKNLQGRDNSINNGTDSLCLENLNGKLMSNFVSSDHSKSKIPKASSSSDVSRKVAHKRSLVQNRLQHGSVKKGPTTQKNAKVKIDGKTISLTFEVKDVQPCDLKEWQNMTKSLKDEGNTKTKGSTSTVESSRDKSVTTKTSPEMRIVTNVNEVSNGTKYVSLLNGRNNSITLKKELVTLNSNTEHSLKNGNTSLSENSKESVKTSDKTREMEKEVISLLANASEERSRIEQERTKGTPGRKKCGKPCGNLPNNDTLFKCDVCGLEFNRHGNFTRHKLIHDVKFKDRYKCQECDRKFLQRCDLKRHMLIHSNQEPYRCPECDKGYIRRSDLVVHMRFHKKERIFSCPYCLDRKFCQSGDLNRHIRTIHLQSATYKCTRCEKQFSKEPALIQHQFTCPEPVIHNSKKKNKSLHSKMKTSSKKKQD